MVLKQCSGFGGHSLEGSKGGYSGFLKKFYSISCLRCLKFRIWTQFKVPEINLRFFLRLGALLGASRFFQDSRDYFQNLTSELAETWYEYKMWGFWDEFEVLPKIDLFFQSFQGFFRIPGIISRTWPQNWLKLGTNTKYEVSEMNLGCFLKLGSFLGVHGAFLGFQGLFPEPYIRIGWKLVRIQNVRFLRLI